MPAVEFPAVAVARRAFGIAVPALTLQHGEILGIFGKSGAGKTTYLRALRERFSPERVVYLSQFDSLLEEITIRQNLELGLACSALPRERVRDWESAHADLLVEFEVDRHLRKYPRQMSGGQRKRAEIVRCLMMEPEILLLDEPFQGIGHLFESVSTKHLLRRAASGSGVTMIVSHDFELLARFCDRILLVDERGVIETVPARDPAWRPSSVRSAWTMGVENVLPSELARELGAGDADGYLCFWGRHARWSSEGCSDTGGLSLRIPASRIEEMRSYLVHGTAYSQVAWTPAAGSESAVVVGEGSPPHAGDAVLHVRAYWSAADG